MASKRLRFTLYSVKKHSILYQNEEYEMTIYIKNNIIKELTQAEAGDAAPNTIDVTFELSNV